MADNPIKRWRQRAPLWQVFLFSAILFGALTWLLQPTEPVLVPAVGGVFFGAVLTGQFGYQRHTDRSTAGVGDEQVRELNRAIKTGRVPVEPELHDPMMRMIDRRRGQSGWSQVLSLVVFTAMLGIGVYLVIAEGPWPWLVPVAVFAGLDVLSVVQPITMRHKLDRMAAQLDR